MVLRDVSQLEQEAVDGITEAIENRSQQPTNPELKAKLLCSGQGCKDLVCNFDNKAAGRGKVTQGSAGFSENIDLSRNLLDVCLDHPGFSMPGYRPTEKRQRSPGSLIEKDPEAIEEVKEHVKDNQPWQYVFYIVANLFISKRQSHAEYKLIVMTIFL